MVEGPDPGDEAVEWLDDDGDVIAIVTRARMRRENLRHRSCGIVVRSTDGRLLVHRRAMSKDLLPGRWDVCAGGVLGVGEAPLDGARRELAEELGIDVDEAALRLLGAGRHDDDHSREMSTVFEVTHDGPFLFSDGEVSEVRWVDRAALTTMMTRHEFLPSCARLVLPLVPGFADAAGAERAAGTSAEQSPSITTVHRIEFTIEPFVEGRPGPHVTEAIAAVESLGIAVEIGPFGSTCTVATTRVGEVVASLSTAATAHGATHVHLDITDAAAGPGGSDDG